MNQEKIKPLSNYRCLICSTLVDESRFDEKEVDEYFYTNNRSKAHFKNYITLFCNLTNTNLEDFFGQLFASLTNEDDPPSCSRCCDLLVNVWKLQEIIKQTQSLQQKDVNILKNLLLKNPANQILTPGEKTTAASFKKCSVILTRCDDLIHSTSKAKRPSLPSNTNCSKTSPRRSKLNCLQLIKTLASPEETKESILHNDTEMELEFLSENDYFHPDDFSSVDELEYLHDPLEPSADDMLHETNDKPLPHKPVNNSLNPSMFDTDEDLNLDSKPTLEMGCRDVNFSKVEINTLSKLAYENREMLYPKLHPGKTFTTQQRQTTWRNLTASVNSAGGRNRAVSQIKKKFYNMLHTLYTMATKGSVSSGESSESESNDDDITVQSLTYEPGEEQVATSYYKSGLSKRSANFSRKESKLISKLVRENANVLSAKVNSTTNISSKQKAEIWRKITVCVNRKFGNNRSVDQIRKKVYNGRTTERHSKVSADIQTSTVEEDINVQNVDTEVADECENASDVILDNPDSKPDLSSLTTETNKQTEYCPSRRTAKNKRLSNFNYDETQMMIKLCQENRKLLFAKTNLTNGFVSHRRKRQIWVNITNAVNKVGGQNRSVVQIQKKVHNMRNLLKESESSGDNFFDKIDFDNIVADTEIGEDIKFLSSCEDKQPTLVSSKQTEPGKKIRDFFSPMEVQLLVKLVNKNKSVLYPPRGAGVMPGFKNVKDKIWTQIANAMNAATGKNRTGTQLQKKMFSLSKMDPKAKREKTEVSSDPTTDVKLEAAESGLSIEEENCETMRSDPISIATKKIRGIVAKRLKNRREKSWRNPHLTKCDQCKHTFSSIYALRSHQVTHLPKSTRKQFMCSQCGDQLLSERAVKFHMIRIHNEDPGECLVCHICDMKFYPFEGFQFRRHVESHTGKPRPRPFMCDACGQGFFTRKGLENHANVHSTKRLYQCEVCTESYKHKCNLDRHVKSCHKELISETASKCKPFIPYERRPDFIGPRIAYPCEFCDKAFQLPSRLTKHLRVCRVRKGMQCE